MNDQLADAVDDISLAQTKILAYVVRIVLPLASEAERVGLDAASDEWLKAMEKVRAETERIRENV